jgi:hypothetical protein
MIGQQPTRQCGNCGQPIVADDVLCPHCDALLAAYEPPSGATAGTSAALNPVDMTPGLPAADLNIPATSPSPPAGPDVPYESPTAQTLEALDAQRPQAGTTSTTFNLPQSSPVAEALERTRVAADLDALGERSDASDEGVQTSPKPLAEKERQLLGMSVKPIRTPDTAGTPLPQPEQPWPPQEGAQSTTVERVRAQAEAGWYGKNRDAQQIARQATASKPARPTPEQRAQPHNPPVRPVNRNRNAQGKTSPGFGSFIGFFIIAVIVLSNIGSGAFPRFIVLPIIIIGLIWFMTTVAKNTGRKTTWMPKDKNRGK